MTVTYEAAFANAMAAKALDLIDNGSTGSGAYGCFETSGDVIVASIQFNDPAGVVTGDTLDWDVTPALEDTSAAGGTIEHFSVYDNSGAFEAQTGKQFEVSCQTGAGTNVVVVSSLTVGVGSTVTLGSASWQFPTVQ